MSRNVGGAPEAAPILFVADLQDLLGYEHPSAVRRALHRGDLGPYFSVGRRLAVLRSSLLEALQQREQVATAARGESAPPPEGLARYDALLKGSKRKGGRRAS